MSCRSRKQKAFFRLIQRLEQVPITKIGSFIFIDEGWAYRGTSKKRIEGYHSTLREIKRSIKSGRLASAAEFDNLYSPYFDLTVEINKFEKNREKVNQISYACLSQIAKKWRLQITNVEGSAKYVIDIYYENNEWFMNCYHQLVEK